MKSYSAYVLKPKATHWELIDGELRDPDKALGALAKKASTQGYSHLAIRENPSKENGYICGKPRLFSI